jgi:hypothetical protein
MHRCAQDADIGEVSALLADAFPFEINMQADAGFKSWEVQVMCTRAHTA